MGSYEKQALVKENNKNIMSQSIVHTIRRLIEMKMTKADQ